MLATIICFVTDGLLHQHLLEDEWGALYGALAAQPPAEHSHGASLISFFDFELGRGLGGVFIYAMMRARYRPGPRTAAFAGLVIWVICSVTGPAQFIPLGFYSHELWLKVGAYQLVTTLAATLAGAAVYREAQTAPAETLPTPSAPR
jgi:hypothetical protein